MRRARRRGRRLLPRT
uniref:Uncharacterized protein n=1 Tax=Arundo donax TaxID=35708 RepID=A0A0A9BFU3_ARUDO